MHKNVSRCIEMSSGRSGIFTMPWCRLLGADLLGDECRRSQRGNPVQFAAMGTPSAALIADRLAEILRRDLKLGESARITPETVLIGGAHDLDSLDVLMLITSVEKAFNIKIPNEEIRKDAFTSVATLTAYIQNRLASRGEK